MPELDTSGKSFDSPSIAWVDLLVTEDCNLFCKYCFHKAKPEKMSPAMAVTAIKFLKPQSEENLIINFFGGEPFLNPSAIKAVIAHVDSLNLKYRFGICTNGTIFDEELLEILKSKKASIQVSLDGDKETHNANRGKHEETVTNIKKMLAMGITPSVRMTYTAENVERLADNAAFIYSLGVNRIMHQAVMDNSWTDEAVAKFKRQHDKMIQFVSNNTDLHFSFFDRLFNYRDLSEGLLCKAGKTLVAVLPNGDVYPCHRFASQRTYKLGDIYSKFTRGLFLDLTRNSLRVCRNCEAKSICHTCLAANYEINGSMLEPILPHCALIKYEYETAKKVKQAKEVRGSIMDMLTKIAQVELGIVSQLDSLERKVSLIEKQLGSSNPDKLE